MWSGSFSAVVTASMSMPKVESLIICRTATFAGPDDKSVVALGSLEVLARSDLPSDALDLLNEHRRELRRVWRLLNPQGSKR